MYILTIDEALQQFPFIKTQFTSVLDGPYCPLEFTVSEFDDTFLDQSLLEDESEALGHFHVRKKLYVARGDTLYLVDVQRSSTKIYPPEYLRGREYPSDELGRSETIRGALRRQDFTDVHSVVLYTNGCDGYTKHINSLLIALVKNKILSGL